MSDWLATPEEPSGDGEGGSRRARHQDQRARARSKHIGRNTSINVIGAVLPIFISLVTVPAYLHQIGQDRYGVLAVVWVVLGYFGVFDLGLSRATANQIARLQDRPDERERVFWTALSVNATIGTVGGVILLLLGNLLLEHVLKVPSDLRSEAISALPWLAAAVPLTTVTLVFVGALEGRELFLTVNVLTIVGIALFQLVPLGYAYWVSPALPGLIMSATLALLASTLLALVVTSLSVPLRHRPRIELSRLPGLMRYGGWITVTGLVGPILTVVDRIAIAAILGARAVTRYSIPFLLVSRAQIISSALARALFPRFSMLDRGDAAAVGRDSLRVLVAVLTPITVAGAIALEPFLRAWVGADLGEHSAPVGEILLLGMWANSLAVVPYAFLQAQGRPDLPAKFHVLEVPPYLVGLFFGLHAAGIEGAAWAWTARAGVDAVLLFAAAARVSPSERSSWRVAVAPGALVTLACVASLVGLDDPAVRAVTGLVLVLLALAWSLRILRPYLSKWRLRSEAAV